MHHNKLFPTDIHSNPVRIKILYFYGEVQYSSEICRIIHASSYIIQIKQRSLFMNY